MHTRFAAGVAVVLLLACASASQAQPGRSPDGIWAATSERPVGAADAPRSVSGPFAVVRLDKPALDRRLEAAPRDADAPLAPGVELTLPMPDGTFARFRVQETSMLAPELQRDFPALKTYTAMGIDEPRATARLDWTARGFHAMVLTPAGSVYVDPYVAGQLDVYISYRKSDLAEVAPFVCLVSGDAARVADATREADLSNGTTRRTYRLMLAATAEYTAAAGGTKLLALSRMTTTMNRVNGIYQRDLSVAMTVATGTLGNSTALIYLPDSSGDPYDTDPYTNNEVATMLSQNQTTIDAVVGSANYDIGHVFGTGGGGIAGLRVPCGPGKARGVTGLSTPVGDAFDVDYVAHEMGHQFGANHTFNGASAACAGNRAASHAYEVGSASTIMGYAGICTPQNTQNNSNDYFHVESLNEIVAFITNGATGGSCPAITALGNAAPTVSAGASYAVPKQTPFTLSASGGDSNGDALTFDWEQYDLGAATDSVTAAATDDGSIPLFRSYSPLSSPSRTFPSLPFVLNNANTPPPTFTGASVVAGYVCSAGTCLTGEVLPNTSRVLHFVVSARDGRGGLATSATTVTVDATAGPFRVTAPNGGGSVAGHTTQLIAWSVNGTAALAPNVAILLSTDGGVTFATVLAAATPNDGSESVTVPNLPTASARVKIAAVGGVFFDVSDANFTILEGNVAPTITQHPVTWRGWMTHMATFTAAATGSPAPNPQWQGSSDGGVTWANIPFAGSATYTVMATASLNHYQVRAYFQNSSGLAVTLPAEIVVHGRSDFDGNATPDLVWRHADTGADRIWQLYGGTSVLGSVTLDAVSDPAWQMAALGDMNGDFQADIIWRNRVTGENAVWLMNGTTYAGYAPLDAVTDTRWQLAGTEDFNDDGKTDLVWRNGATGDNIVWLMDGTRYVSYRYLPPVADTNWRLVAVGDLSMDGMPDLLWRHIATGENIVWFLNGTSYEGYSYVRAEPDLNWSVALVDDFSGDGHGDILWRNYVTGDNRVWEMHGADFGSTMPVLREADVQWRILAGPNDPLARLGPADFNRDGAADLLWRNTATGENILWYLSGGAYLSYTRLDAVSDTNWRSVATGDFNADGKPDIFWRNVTTGENIIWLMNGASYAGYVRLADVPIAWRMSAVADFNRDGSLDLLWRNGVTGENIIWYLNGTNYAAYARVDTVADTSWRIGGAADFNGDGAPDILWRNGTTGENLVWYLRNAVYVSYARLASIADPNWQAATVADYDQNGSPDVLWRNAATGETIIWYLNGVNLVSYRRLETIADLNWKAAQQQ